MLACIYNYITIYNISELQNNLDYEDFTSPEDSVIQNNAEYIIIYISKNLIFIFM